jgi:uncharacterized damage-inducible protein DinB
MTIDDIRASLMQSAADTAALFDASDADLAKTYGPGKWSIRQILVHLADAEFVYLWRVSRAIAETGSPVEGFNQDLWAERLRYDQRSLLVSKALFESSRSQLLEYVGVVTEAELHHTVQHSEHGPIPLWTLLQGHAAHCEHHLDQIEAAQEGRIWQPTGL